MEYDGPFEETLTEAEAVELSRQMLERSERIFRKNQNPECVLDAIIIATGSGIAIPEWAAFAQANINQDLLAIRDGEGKKQRTKESAVYQRLGFHKLSSRKKDNGFELYLYGQEVHDYRDANRTPAGRLPSLPSVYAELEGAWDGEHPTWSELKKGHQYYQRMKRKSEAQRKASGGTTDGNS